MNIKASALSWKTTLAGFFSFLILALPEFKHLLDNDPATIPNWSVVVGAAVVFVGFFASKDGDKSSEQLGLPHSPQREP